MMLSVLLAAIAVSLSLSLIMIKRKKTWQAVNKSIYVHLTDSGKIFIIKGESGAEKWVSLKELKEVLAEIKKNRGEILYSRENPGDENPFCLVKEIFDEIASYQLPMKIVEQHPRTREI